MSKLRRMASRKEEKERRRQERLAREEAARQRAHARRLYAYIVGGVLGVAAIAAIVLVIAAGGDGGSSDSGGSFSVEPKNTLTPPPQQLSNLFVAAKAAKCELKNPEIAGRTHIPPKTKVKYATNPPTSGNHDPVPTPDGVYSKQPNPRNLVHTLEHGRVELQYKSSLPERTKRQLGGLFKEDAHLLLLYPNDTMPYKVAAATWGHLIGCKRVSSATFDALRAFIGRYRDTAPESSQSQPANF